MSAAHGSPPPPPEPPTPAWLTALGAVLFLAVGVWWLSTQPASAKADAADAGVSDAAPAAP